MVTDFRKILAFRNILAHNYDSLANEAVWDVIQSDIPVLLREVEALLREPDG